MIVNAHPLANRKNLQDVIDRMVADALNIRGASGGGAASWLMKYLDWANDTAQALHNQLTREEIDRLVFTPRYSALLAAAGTMALGPNGDRVINGLLRVETQQRCNDFEQLRDALREKINRWTSEAMFVVCDTNFFLHSDRELGYINFHQLIFDAGRDHGFRLEHAGNTVHLLMPSRVLLELDRAKNTNREARSRAGRTLRTIDDWFKSPSHVHREAPRPASRSVHDYANFSAELLLDPLGHVPMTVGDDEIIDRIVAAKPLAGRDITLITFDTHMSTKARINGVPVIKLQQPDPPDKAKGK